MSIPRGQQHILDAIEKHLRASDPELVSSFGALAASDHRRPITGWIRPPQVRARWARWRAVKRALIARLGVLIPVILLGAISLVIMAVASSPQRYCGPATFGAAVHQAGHCATSTRPQPSRWHSLTQARQAG